MEALSVPADAVPAAPAEASGGRSRARTGLAFLVSFGLAAAGVGAARAITTSFLPVLLQRISDAPALIGTIMLVNAAAGFAVPLGVGLWSDRRAGGRLGRRMPFMVGGAVLTSGGLVAIALGTGTSYAVLALAAATTYVGLNAASTAHRALIVEGFADDRRPAATSAQEVAMLVGGLAGVVAGGVLIDSALWLPFAIAAVAVPLLTAPTVTAVRRRLGGGSPAAPSGERPASGRLSDLRLALRRPGAREVLVAQTLWVAAYAALPAFFVLYAGDVLGLGAGTASLLLASFGIVSGVGMLLAGRARPEHVHPLLMLGAGLLGLGLLTGALLDTPASLALPFAAAALGFGLVSALGFPYYARFVPDGQSGRYSGLYFSVRAIASTVALPLAGLLIQVSGSYRMLLVQGATALVALVPLARARERSTQAREVEVADGPLPDRVAAVIPCYGCDPAQGLVSDTLRHVDRVVLVDDGSPPEVGERIDALITDPRVEVVRLEANSGKGDAVAAGAAALMGSVEAPDAIMVVDADGQHPPDRIPAFVEAARHADVVIGNRLDDPGAMPLVRRITNRVSSALLSLVARRRVHDSQCGMRLYRTEALERVPLPRGRYEAETRHIKAVAREGLRLGWVSIPAIYEGAPSHFRPIADTARVLAAIFSRPTRAGEPEGSRIRERLAASRPSGGFVGSWATRLATVLGGVMALAALTPLAAPIDEQLFVAINSLGDGPEWLYWALDPHTRNYVLLSVLAVVAATLIRPRWGVGALLAVIVAAFASDLLLQPAYLLYDRARPEEAVGGEVLLSHGRTWGHLASFPSGHMAVTTAIAVAATSAAPALRRPLWVYVAAVAATRVLFGAHFPLDVAVGVVLGYEVGRFSAALAHAVGLLPARPPVLPSLARLRCRLRPVDCEAGLRDQGATG